MSNLTLFLLFCFTFNLIASWSLRLRPYVTLVVSLSLLSSPLLELIKWLEEQSGHVHAAETIEFVHAFHYVTAALLAGWVVSNVVMIVNQKRQQSLDERVVPIE